MKGNKLYSIQPRVEEVVSKNFSLKEDAELAFKIFLKNIILMKNKKVFDIASIDFDMLARLVSCVAIFVH